MLVFLKQRKWLEMNNRKGLNHKVGDIHVCQQESIIYIPLKKHLTIQSTWDYRLVLEALNYITVGDSLDPLSQREQDYSGFSHHQKCSELSHGGDYQACWRRVESR